MEILNSNKYLNLSICADDFGYSNEINKSIINLVKKDIVTETSCLINMHNKYEDDFHILKNISNKVNTGLHLLFLESNFTNDYQLYYYNKTFRKFLINSHLNIFNKNKIKDIIENQLDIFERIFERPPDFIDSHMHVHQFPYISDIFLNLLISRYEAKILDKIWIRNTQSNIIRKTSIKSKILSYYGKNFKKKLLNKNLKTNINFIGSYDFKKNFQIKNYYKTILYNFIDQTLLMTHPASNNYSNKNIDEIHAFRELEYNFLVSSEFNNLLKKNGIKIKKLDFNSVVHL